MTPDARRRRLLGGLALAPLAACTSYGAPEPPDLAPLAASVAQTRWSHSLDAGAVNLVAAMSADRLVVADAQGEVVFLRPDNGRVLSRAALGAPGLVAGVGSDGERHAVATTDGRLIVVDDQGERLWSADLGADVLSVPSVGAGLVIVRLSNASLAAYDLQSGVRRWVHNRRPVALVLRHPSWLAVDPSAVFAGLPSGRLVALSPGNGATLWEATVSLPRGTNEIERITDVVAAPVAVGGRVYALAYQGRLVALDARTGRGLWARDVSGGSGLDADLDGVVAVDTRDNVLGFSVDGEPTWTNGVLRGRRLGVPRLVDGRIWVGDAGGLVHVIDARDGRLIGRAEGDGDPIVAPGRRLPDGAVAFQSLAGTVFSVAVRS